MEQEVIPEDVSKRITSLRFLLAIFVVMIHNYFSKQSVVDADLNGKILIFNQTYFSYWITLFFSQGICRCAVPLFFMFGGYLHVRKIDSYGQILKKKVKSLLLPYIIWAFIYYIHI